ncbi:tetratricopeptide repeat protein [bacterium]|nr:tetratricopeptide repeat protein [bacterium]
MSNGIIMQAQMLIDNEDYDKAYEMLTKAYDKLKEDAEYLEQIALLAKTMDKNEDAAKYWEELVVINPNSLVGYSELLDIYNNTNKYKYYITRAKYKILNEKVSQSIDDYKKAISSTTEESEQINARFLLAKALEHVGKVQEAIDEYFRIIELKDDIAIYHKLADLYSEMGDRFSAISVLEKAVKAFPEVPTLAEYLSALYLKEGQYDKSLEHATNDYSRIKAYLMKGENQTAFELLEKNVDEKNANYIALMAEYYFNTKDWTKTTEYIDKFNELSPQNPLVYQMRALVCDENGDDYGYHYNMGKCYSYKQNYDLALAEYLNAHRYDATKADAIKEIIKINESMGDKTSLMEFYEKLVRQEPENTFALKGLGDIYTDLYEFRNALEYYKKAEKLNSNDYELFSKMAFACEKVKDMASAKEYYEKYLAKAPLSPDSEKIKEKLAKMGDVAANAVQEEEGFIDRIMSFFSKK